MSSHGIKQTGSITEENKCTVKRKCIEIGGICHVQVYGTSDSYFAGYSRFGIDSI